MKARMIWIAEWSYGPDLIVQTMHALAAVVSPGDLAVQLRSREPLALKQALLIRSEARRFGLFFILNRHLELAKSLDVDGIHLGSDPSSIATLRSSFSLPWISTSAHNDQEVEWAAAHKADAILVSPIFHSPGKGAPRGLAAISSARRLAPKSRIYALGGIDATCIDSCFHTGSDGIAAIRPFFDPVARRALLHQLYNKP